MLPYNFYFEKNVEKFDSVFAKLVDLGCDSFEDVTNKMFENTGA